MFKVLFSVAGVWFVCWILVAFFKALFRQSSDKG